MHANVVNVFVVIIETMKSLQQMRRISLALMVRNMVGFPSWQIIAKRSFRRFCQYVTELGSDFRKAKFFSTHPSMNCLSSICFRVILSVALTHLNVLRMPSTIRSLRIFITI